MWRTSLLFVMVSFFLLICRSDNLTIPECSSDFFIDVREDTGTTITCGDIEGPTNTIYWALSGKRIGDCGNPNFVNCSLTDNGNTDYKLTRPNAHRGELRIVGNFRPKALQTIKCSLYRNTTQVSCVINIVYPGNITSPVFETDPKTWTVKALYGVQKVYSSRNQYRCMWTMANDKNATMQTNTTEMERFNFSESRDLYYRGACLFSWTLPTGEGLYTFSGKFVPGTVETLHSIGKVKVEHPGDPTIDCEQWPVVEAGNFTCQCRLSGTKPGNPAPSVSWPGFSDSGNLTLVNVSRVHNGTQHMCKLTWGPNANIVKTANYTLKVEIFGPSKAYIFNATEISIYHRVCLVCRADDVYPSAKFTWKGVTCDSAKPLLHAASGTVNSTSNCMLIMDNETLNESVCEFTPLPNHHGADVTCTAANTYTGTLFASATWRIELTLPQVESQVFPAAAVGGGVGAVIAIAIVIGIVLVVVRRNRLAKRSQDKENFNTNNSEEFEGHISSVYEVADNLQDPAHQPEFTPKPVAEALRIPSGNAGNTYGNAATDEDMMDPETDAEYSTVSKVNPRSVANEGSDRYAYKQITSGPAAEGDKPVQNKSDPRSVATSQEDVYAVVDKSKKTPQPSSNASSPNSSDQTDDKGPSPVVHKQVHNPLSKLRDTDALSTPEGRDTKLHRDTKTHKPTAAAKPVVKAMPDVKPKPNHQQSSSAGSDGERMHKRDNRADRQYYYENVEPSFSHAPSHVQQGSEQTTKEDDEYNTLGLVEPHAALRRDPDPEYSHLAAL